MRRDGVPPALLKARLESIKRQSAFRKAQRMTERALELRGNNALIQDTAHFAPPEWIISGPAGTGKTLALLTLLNRLLWMFPGTRLLIVRKVRAHLSETTLVTFERDVLGLTNPIIGKVQRRNRSNYVYPNGSMVILGGMDDPGAFLSGEYDIIYAAEANQFSLDDWELLISRNRSMFCPFKFVCGDTNPSHPRHWILKRRAEGLLTLLETTHRDNPRYWNALEECWTPEGEEYVIGKLGRMTGIRRARYLEGKWVSAEGAIYDNFSEANITENAVYDPSRGDIYWFVDDGYQNMRVILIAQVARDGTVYILAEHALSQQTEPQAIESARKLHNDLAIPKPEACYHDPSAAAWGGHCIENNIFNIPANNKVKEGIKAVREYISDGQGRISLYIHPRCQILIEQLYSYQYAPVKPNSSGGDDPPPLKVDDHAPDALRYGIATIALGN
ncbi:MAG: phage terminase large subunit [Chloroflexota bacterium]|nr:phage terminase large subunit [Chloroflexota bacterium]